MTDPIARLNAALRGRYRIESKLGEGGMALVYLADDLRHERRVALKVLKPELAAVVGADRFLAEIKTTANLQHPHILPLHDSGKADEFLYYVMPYVEGESLRDRLGREKQLPVEDAVQIATHVGEALDYAHRHGVVHRDIKPANILLLDGKPLIADFGIARAVGGVEDQRLTDTGISLGSPAYMSPEQATGDHGTGPASDVYALGCVLYEMLTGEPPFVAGSTQATLLKIITDEPQRVTEARKSVPPNVAGAVSKALEKLPADRFKDAESFARALGDPGFAHPRIPAAEIRTGAWRLTSVTSVLAAVAVVLAFAAGWALRGDEQPVTRFSLDMPDGESLLAATGGRLSIAPDGRSYAYVGAGPGPIWIRDLDRLRATALSGTEGGFSPTFSPDGRTIAFRQGDAVMAAQLDGSPPIVLADGISQEAPGLIDWGPDGFVYLAMRGLFRVPEGGGEWEQVIPRDTAQRWHLNPEILPNGRGAVFTLGLSETWSANVIAVADFETGETRTLGPGTAAIYSGTGHLLIVRVDGTLDAVPFDQDALGFTGPPSTVGTDIGIGEWGSVDLSLSETGTLLYATGAQVPQRQVVWVDQAGFERPVHPGWTGPWESVALSPDGRRLAVGTGFGAKPELWVKTLDEGPMTRLTLEGELNRRPVWSEDGEWITFISKRGEYRAAFRKRSDGVGEAEVVLQLPEHVDEIDWSPNEEWLVYRTGISGGEGRDIHAWHVGRDSARMPIAANPAFDERSPVLSPDGRWLAYISYESGTAEIFVRSFPDIDAYRLQISSGGGGNPTWADDGETLYYRATSDSDSRLMAVRISRTPPLAVLERRTLFSLQPYFGAISVTGFDVREDGLFVMIREDDAPARSDLILVQNFDGELERRIPD